LAATKERQELCTGKESTSSIPSISSISSTPSTAHPHEGEGSLPKSRPANTPKPSAPAEGELLPALDPLRLLWSLTAAALAIMLAYLHAFPQAPYPSHGIVPSLGFVVLTAASALIVARAPWLRAPTLIPIPLSCIFLVWALWRTWVGLVPSEGVSLLGTLLEGTLVFAIALTLAAVGGGWRSVSLRGSAASLENEAAGRHQSDASSAPARSLLLDGAIVFLLALAAAMAFWAIYQYLVLYDQQLVEFRLRHGAQGLANLSPDQWALFDALRAKRVGSRFGNPNVLAGFLSMAAPLAIGAAATWKDRRAKAFALLILGLIWYVVLLSGSRGGLLTLFFATAAAAVMLGRETVRKQMLTLLIAAGICLGAVLLAIAGESRTSPPAESPTATPLPRARYSFFERLRTSPTLAQRLYYLQSGWEMIRRSPWMGHGLGSYAILYPTYKQPLAREARYPHNILCHLWVETGLVGLALWIAWVGTVFGIATTRLRTTHRGGQTAAIRMLGVAVAAFVFNNLFEMTWTFRETYLDWCLIMGILAGFGATEASETEQTSRRPAPESLRPIRPTLAIAAVPLALGITLADSVIIRPMLAESSQIAATDLLDYGRGKEVVNEVWRLGLRMIQYQPHNARYHDWLACFYSDLGRLEDARREFEAALRCHPRSAKIRADFAAFEERNGQTDRARQLLADALDIYPLNPQYHYQLAELERKAGNLDAARQHIQGALKCVLDARAKPRFEQFLNDLDARTSAPR
jgi:O-antigen ligase